MMPYPRLIDILEHDDVAFPVPSNISTDHITDIVSPSVQLSTTRLPLLFMSPVAQMVTQARHQPSQNGVFPHQQGIISQQSGTASPILNYFMPAAEAHPLVIYVGMAAASAATGLLVARQSQIASDQPHGTNFPVHQHEPSLSSFPLHDDLGNHLEEMPIEQVLGQQLETPVEQPGFDWNHTIFPIVAPSLLFYLRSQNRSETDQRLLEKRLSKAKLPMESEVVFLPPKNYFPTKPLAKGPKNGYFDSMKNEWVKGPSRTPSEPHEWDIQLSKKGLEYYNSVRKGRNHLNVSLKGKITH